MTSPGPLTARRLNRATLARQLLLERAPLDVVEGVRRVVALQAQEAASPYLALWARLSPLDPADVDRAFADGSVVKTSLMRLTLHAIAAEDDGPFRAAMQALFRAAGLVPGPGSVIAGMPAEAADDLLREVAVFLGEPRTNADVEAWLGERLGADAASVAWRALRIATPLRHAPTGPPWSFGPRPAYRAAPMPDLQEDAANATATLLRRYLEGFGPASIADIGQFTKLPRGSLKEAAAVLGDALVHLEGPDGRALLDVPGAPLPDEGVPAPPRLLPMWDSVLFAYDDRSRVIPPDHRRHVIRTNGDTLPTLLVDGRVAGVWRATDDGIEATAFEPLSGDAWAGLEAEARSLLAFLADRDARVYSRYGRWWDQLRGTEVRVLGR